MNVSRLAGVGAALASLLPSVAATPLETWSLQSPWPVASPVRDAARSVNGLWVAVGDSGTVLTSSDSGESWVRQSSGVTNAALHFRGVAFTNGQFVAVGDAGLCATSPNGTNWTMRTISPDTRYWNAVAHGAGRYVAVAGVNSTNVAVSADAVTWSLVSFTNVHAFNDVMFDGGLFVGVGFKLGGLGFVATSADGTNWIERLTNSFQPLQSVTRGGGLFVGVGGSATVTSPDGLTWNLLTNATAPDRIGVAHGNGLFAAAAAQAPNYSLGGMYTSPDGTNWTLRANGAVEGMRFANGEFVAVGTPASAGFRLYGTIHTSTNGTNWIQRAPLQIPSSAFPARGIAFGNGVFSQFANEAVTFGNGIFVGAVSNVPPQTDIYTSTDGTNVMFASSIFSRVNGMTFANATFVAVGEGGSIYSSSDATNWNGGPTSITNELFALAHGGGTYVVVGAAGTVAYSPDLMTWTEQSIAPSNHLRGITFALGQFVAVGDGGRVFTSPNGSTWTAQTSGTVCALNAVIFSHGRYIAVGEGGVTLSSMNGIAWTAATRVVDHTLRSLATSGSRVIAVADHGIRQASDDGLVWRRDGTAGESVEVRKLIHSNGQFFGAADAGVVISPGGRTWHRAPLFGTFHAMLATNGMVIVGGMGVGNAKVAFSVDGGGSWQESSVGAAGAITGLAHGNGTFVGVRSAGGAATSTDLLSWALRNTGTNGALNDIAFGNGVFVATIAGSSNVLTTADGVAWTIRPTGINATYQNIVFRDGLFRTAGSRIVSSPDGVTWTDRGAPSTSLKGVDSSGSFHIAYGSSGQIFVSTDFSTWTPIFTGTQQHLQGAAFGNDSAVVVGRAGTVLQSAFLMNTPAMIVASPSNIVAIDGSTVRLIVTAAGRSPIKYQWFRDGVAIAGATGPVYTIPIASSSDAGNYTVRVTNEFGSQTSGTIVLSVITATVAAQPSDNYAFLNGNGTFTAVVSGVSPTGYQWRRGFGLPASLPGETNSTLTITNAQYADADAYSVLVTFVGGEVVSPDATLGIMTSLEEVSLGIDPAFLQVAQSDTASITSIITGPIPISYQWTKDGTNIPGAIQAVLTLTNVQASDEGDYNYSVTYGLGSLTNLFPATLTSYPAPAPLLTSMTLAGGELIQMDFTGLEGRYYQIEYATNLASPTVWTYYDSYYLNANPGMYWIDPSVIGLTNHGFFRFRILPP